MHWISCCSPISGVRTSWSSASYTHTHTVNQIHGNTHMVMQTYAHRKLCRVVRTCIWCNISCIFKYIYYEYHANVEYSLKTWQIIHNDEQSYLIRAITRRNHIRLWQSPAQIHIIALRCVRVRVCVRVCVFVYVCVYRVMLNCCRSLRQSVKYFIGELSPSTQAAHTPCLSHSNFLLTHSICIYV